MDDDHGAGTESGATSRRALILGAGAASASVLLTACGGDGTTGGATPSGSARPTGSTATGALGRTSDIPVGGGTIYPGQGVVVTQPKAGEFKGFSNICTHQNCPVSNVNGGTINCNCHFSKFSIEDGSVKHGPATRPLPAKDVKVQGDTVTLA
jgi:nitrite reductase/ring-hydroxylating ferredoxin subunit